MSGTIADHSVRSTATSSETSAMRRRTAADPIRPRGVYLPPGAGIWLRMWLLLLLILAVLIFGVWGAVKVAFWVLLIALAVAVVAGFLGRGLFVRRSSF